MKQKRAHNSRDARGTKPRKTRTLSELNEWMAAHHSQLLKAASKNCVRLTGKPTFGGSARRKSA